jgi:hypothetical protein
MKKASVMLALLHQAHYLIMRLAFSSRISLIPSIISLLIQYKPTNTDEMLKTNKAILM